MNAIAKTEVEAFQRGFAQTAPQIKAILPSHIPFEKFERVAMLAVQLEPKLLQCEMKSLFLELQKCAADGLLPDRKEAVITYRWNSKKSTNVAVYQPMIAGVKKLARNSGDVESFTTQIVYEGEPFRIILGDEEKIEHERKIECIDDNKIIGAYAVVILKGGEKVREFMSIGQIEKARNTNKDWAKGPWVTWRDEMCRKTVGHRIAKNIPRSTDRPESDRFHSALDRVASEAVIDGVATREPEPTPSGGRLALLENMVGGTYDEETGEVTDNVADDTDALHAAELIKQFNDCQTDAQVIGLTTQREVKDEIADFKKRRPDLHKMLIEGIDSKRKALNNPDGELGV
jgi:phage RecT family recombinase